MGTREEMVFGLVVEAVDRGRGRAAGGECESVKEGVIYIVILIEQFSLHF